MSTKPKAVTEEKEGEPKERESNWAVMERQHQANREAQGDPVPMGSDLGPENPAYLPENLNTIKE